MAETFCETFFTLFFDQDDEVHTIFTCIDMDGYDSKLLDSTIQLSLHIY